MIVDLDKTPAPPVDAAHDVCIAGAGVAGIVLARRLAALGRSVLVLEAGGLEQSDESQDIYKGRIVGRDYFGLDVARLRYFGGTSNHWGGTSRPLDAHDFLPAPAIAGSGWPIRREDIDPHLAEACAILDIAPFPGDAELPYSGGALREVAFRFNALRFRTKYLEELRASPRITVILNANLLDIPLAAGGGAIAGFVFRGYDTARPWQARARHYVLALGGIENARALLNAGAERPAGLGNDRGLVGRYFMDHPQVDLGYYVAAKEFGIDQPRFWAPMASFMRAKGIGGCTVMLEPVDPATHPGFLQRAVLGLKAAVCANAAGLRLARALRPDMACPGPHVVNRSPRLPAFDVSGRLFAMSEQIPNPDSRVLVGRDLDRFGRRRAVLDWRLSPLDKKTLRVSALAVGEYFAGRNIGRVHLHDWLLADDPFI
ncbi:MAG: hypothetical protein RL477_325, partial [Pseudomonadota bacterium]